MNQEEYWDSDFNMREGFYRESMRHSSKKFKPKKARHEAACAQKARKRPRFRRRSLDKTIGLSAPA